MSKFAPRSLVRALLVGSFAVAAVACGGEGAEGAADSEGNEPTTTAVQEPILNGSKATAYAESALITMTLAGSTQTTVCSGALIAPRVVLTAGHCVQGYSKWTVSLPYAGNQTASSTRALTTYQGTPVAIDASSHDVGLIFLDAPMTLPTAFPVLRATAVAAGTKAVNVGRVNNGQISMTDLYVSQQVSLQNADAMGFPYSYSSSLMIQGGDSGGPVVLAGSSPHAIAAVNSGTAGSTQVLARVDQVIDWITGLVNENGGFYGASAPSTAPSAACSPEVEPNDSSGQPQGIASGTVCAQLAAGDQDWFGWTTGSTGLTDSLEVQGTDAQLLVWRLANGVYTQLANQTPQRVVTTTSGAGYYVAAVWSPAGSAQTYKVVASLK